MIAKVVPERKKDCSGLFADEIILLTNYCSDEQQNKLLIHSLYF